MRGGTQTRCSSFFEEDFRFHPGHDVEPLRQRAVAPHGLGGEPWEAAGGSAAEAASQLQRRGRPRAVGVHYEVPARAPREMFAHVSEPLSDIVRCVTGILRLC